MDGTLHIQLIHIDGRPALSVAGEIDIATAAQLEHACRQLETMTDSLLFDFSGVTFLGCAGLDVLESARARDGVVAASILRPSRPVERILRLAAIEGVTVGLEAVA